MWSFPRIKNGASAADTTRTPGPGTPSRKRQTSRFGNTLNRCICGDLDISRSLRPAVKRIAVIFLVGPNNTSVVPAGPRDRVSAYARHVVCVKRLGQRACWANDRKVGCDVIVIGADALRTSGELRVLPRLAKLGAVEKQVKPGVVHDRESPSHCVAGVALHVACRRN